MKAHDMLRPGEQILAIYTTGYGFEVMPDLTGSTKAWSVDPNHALQVNRIIIYHRNETVGTNHLHVASIDRLERDTDSPDRWKIYLQHCQFVGAIEEDWSTFAGVGQNPIRYLQ